MQTSTPTRPPRRRPLTPDTVLGLVLVVLSAVFLAATLGLSAEAAAWPRGVLLALAALGAAIAVRGRRAPAQPAPPAGGTDTAPSAEPDADAVAAAAEARDPEGAGDGDWRPAVLRRPAIALGIIVAYVALLEVAGFLAATGLYLLAHLWFNGVRDWRVFAGVAVGVVAFIHFLFAYELSVPLPAGMLFE
ncbi:tripartite tricarboxylate transporter TctB family protein [Streptomonospora nanhaiensis]|uniref:DUF1468 domain-containing protein n=2 Tax=Streptomonospora nanhaiensis TaxID=1323731 RepID=A0A853BVD6_9ACTN|nr:tripartite tricarboxylate transporter TctB family protein [Streptomonospora nanhaiensis]MBV2365431.1 tripartite tricarboxylate transporter TctB family protein [Streptomonospora nanhaiensis]NYI98974.1 hypothetical protein [Streptomonospora nanhaiensis]